MFKIEKRKEYKYQILDISAVVFVNMIPGGSEWAGDDILKKIKFPPSSPVSPAFRIIRQMTDNIKTSLAGMEIFSVSQGALL